LNENRGNTTYKTGEGASGSLYPQSSMQTRKQIPGTLTVASTGGLAPVFGPTAGDAAAGGSGTANGAGANAGAGGAISTIAAGVASTSDIASAGIGGGSLAIGSNLMQSLDGQLSTGSGF
jgi:hypothetical protein